jgi:hypothetical protein
MLRYLLIFLLPLFIEQLQAQSTLVARYTSAANRAKLNQRLVNHAINKNLALPLNDSTAEFWEEAFYVLELLNRRSSWIDGQITNAVAFLPAAPYSFQRSLLELLYTNYRGDYSKEVASFTRQTVDPKLYSMAVEYLLADSTNLLNKDSLFKETNTKFGSLAQTDPILIMLRSRLYHQPTQLTTLMLGELLNKKFLQGNVILYSLQRTNRDIPGTALIRDAEGNFLMQDSTTVFSVPHFARSLSSLPGYLTNGNTPQGIFRMTGYGVSSSEFIGPSVNIQMCMPVECSISVFFDSTVSDTAWSDQLYSGLLPASLYNYFPIYGSYYAGAAGRTEIIAHGTTVDPDYYQGKIYHPHTPSLGCLTTAEIWDKDGRRVQSNQQKLIDALTKAGGPKGYCVVIELPGDGPIDVNEITSNLNLPTK